MKIAFSGIVDFRVSSPALAGFERGLAQWAAGDLNARSRTVMREPVAMGLLSRSHDQAFAAPVPLHASLLLVADVRLDRRETLGAELALKAATHSDAELVAAAYLRWGRDCVQHLKGEYAVAIWDPERRELFCFRDPLGHRQLYYACGPDRFAFASQGKALLDHGWISREPDPARLAEFLGSLSEGIEPERTFYRDIKRLPGGKTLTFSERGLTIAPYWWPERIQEARPADDEAVLTGFRDHFTRALTRSLGQHTQVGLCLSGGFDSSCIALRAAELLAERGASLHGFVSVAPAHLRGVPVETRKVCEALKRQIPNLELHYVDRGDQPLLARPETVAAAEGPVPPLVHRLDLIFRRAREAGIELMLTGYGGDHAVSPRGAGFLCDLLRRGQWRELVRETRARARRTGTASWRILRHELIVPLLPRVLWQLLLHLRDGAAGWRQNLLCTETFARSSGIWAALQRNPSRGFRLRAGIRAAGHQGLTYIQSGRGYDELSHLAWHHGLELARPLLDLELVSFALALPPQQHVRAGVRRVLMRQAFGAVLPPELLERSERNDFIVPELGAWAAAASGAIQSHLEALAREQGIADILDLAKLTALNANWSGEPEADLRNAMLLLRGLSAAQFLKG